MDTGFVEWMCWKCRKPLREFLMVPTGFLCAQCKRRLCRRCAGQFKDNIKGERICQECAEATWKAAEGNG